MVELDLGRLEAAAPLGLVPQTILERKLGVLLNNEELNRSRVVKLGERIETHRVDRIPLATAKQAFQRLDADVSVAVPKLGEG